MKPQNSMVTVVKARVKRAHKKFATDLWITILLLSFISLGMFLFWLLDQYFEGLK